MTDGIQQHILRYPRVEAGVLVAFSGGVDSTVVLRAAVCACGGARTHAVFFKTSLHPAGELLEACRMAQEMGATFEKIEIDELREAGIENNPPERCYLCKRLLFSKLRALGDRLGIAVLLDGTNADDRLEYRPGLRALEELSIYSPLAELGMGKAAVRKLAGKWGLTASSKPSSPCLATRFEYNTPLLPEALERVAQAEAFIQSLGFLAVRVRSHRGLARIEVPTAEIIRCAQHGAQICTRLREWGFEYVTLDLQGLRSGSMDQGLPAWAQKKPE